MEERRQQGLKDQRGAPGRADVELVLARAGPRRARKRSRASQPALIVGEYYFKNGDAANAEKYLALGAQPALSDAKNETRALCLALLAIVELTRIQNG